METTLDNAAANDFPLTDQTNRIKKKYFHIQTFQNMTQTAKLGPPLLTMGHIQGKSPNSLMIQSKRQLLKLKTLSIDM
jgi:hypothetical protein